MERRRHLLGVNTHGQKTSASCFIATIKPTDHGRKQTPATDSTVIALSEVEKSILEQQIRVPVSKPGFFGIYRYASRWDLVFLLLSSVASIIGGAALPLFTVGSRRYLL